MDKWRSKNGLFVVIEGKKKYVGIDLGRMIDLMIGFLEIFF